MLFLRGGPRLGARACTSYQIYNFSLGAPPPDPPPEVFWLAFFKEYQPKMIISRFQHFIAQYYKIVLKGQ